MNSIKKLGVIGILSLLITGAVLPQLAQANACDASGNMSYDQIVWEVAHGFISITFAPSLTTNKVVATVTNSVNCGIPFSLSTYKLFGPYDPATQSSATLFAGTPTQIVPAGGTGTFEVDAPTCMYSYTLWHGNYPTALIDNRVYGEFLAGGFMRTSEFCEPPLVVVVPPVVVPPVVVPPVVIAPVVVPVTPPVVIPAVVVVPQTVVAAPEASASSASASQSGGRRHRVDTLPAVVESEMVQLAVLDVALLDSPIISYPIAPDAGFGPFESDSANVMLFSLPFIGFFLAGLYRSKVPATITCRD